MTKRMVLNRTSAGQEDAVIPSVSEGPLIMRRERSLAALGMTLAAKRHLLLQLMAGIGRPAQPHALAAPERLRRARDVGGRDQQEGTLARGDAVKRAVALIG